MEKKYGGLFKSAKVIFSQDVFLMFGNMYWDWSLRIIRNIRIVLIFY